MLEALKTSPCGLRPGTGVVTGVIRSVLNILERLGNDPEEAIVRAVTHTRDNDTVGAIVGAAVGALHGVKRLPKRWRDGLLGRTGADDDGRVYELLGAAQRKWWS